MLTSFFRRWASLASLSSMVIFLPSFSSVSELSLVEALSTTASATADSGPWTILSIAWPGFSVTGEWFDDIEEEKRQNRSGGGWSCVIQSHVFLTRFSVVSASSSAENTAIQGP